MPSVLRKMEIIELESVEEIKICQFKVECNVKKSDNNAILKYLEGGIGCYPSAW